jgi:hypothetical protein
VLRSVALGALLLTAAAHADGSVPGTVGTADFLARVAARLEALKPSHKHLKRFGRDALSGRAISYSNGITLKPNPDYARLVRQRADEDPRRSGILRARIPTEVPVYDPMEGVDLRISLISADEAGKIQRVVMPFARINGDIVELTFAGAEGPRLAQLRTAVYALIREEVTRTPGGRTAVAYE